MKRTEEKHKEEVMYVTENGHNELFKKLAKEADHEVKTNDIEEWVHLCVDKVYALWKKGDIDAIQAMHLIDDFYCW